MTKVNPTKFVAICNKLGLNVLKQPSQYKVTGANPNHRFYIPGTKMVSKVELSGWTHELAIRWDSVYTKKAPSPKITHILDFNQDEKLILRAFFKMAKSLVAASSKTVETPAAPSSPVTEVLVTAENIEQIGDALAVA